MLDSFSWCRQKLSGILWTTTARGITSCIKHRACGWPRWFGALNSSPHWVAGLTPTYLLPATGQIGVPTASKYGAKPIPYLTLHFRDRRDAASLRRRNRAATTVFVCEQKPYRLIRYDFRGGEKAFRY